MIEHPKKQIVPLAVGLSWPDDGAIYQEKLDGQFSVRTFGRCELAGELMSGGSFVAWDVLNHDGIDLTRHSCAARLAVLNDICAANNVPVVNSSPCGGKLLETVLARGGEGIVRKLPSSTYFDAMQAAKRVGTWQCVVTGLNYSTGGALIKDLASGEDRGTVPLRNRATLCRVGSIVKVEGYGLTARGMIREPRPCKDTANSWLVRF